MNDRTNGIRTVILKRFERIILAIPMDGFRLVRYEGDDPSDFASQTIDDRYLADWVDDKTSLGWERVA